MTETRDTIEDFDVAEFRRRLRQVRLVPYRPLLPLDVAAPLSEHAELLLSDGWVFRGHDPIPLDPPLPWDAIAEHDRTWSYHLHAWRPLTVLLTAHSETSDDRLVRRSVEVVLDWTRTFTTLDTPSPFAWYDMAVGLRADLLAYLVDVVARDRAIADGVVMELIDSARLHDECLSDPGQFALHNNHGLYQAAGHLALSQRLAGVPGISPPEIGIDRLKALLEAHFTTEGIHREHSPLYHERVLIMLDSILSTGFGDDPELFETRDKMERALAWFVLPNGTLAMFGDSDHRLRDHSGRSSDASTEEMGVVVSSGARGRAPEETVVGFEEGGYFIARERGPQQPVGSDDASYLAQITGFHSRTHKHADDLSVIWYDRHREILVDAGRFGYLGKTAHDSEEFRRGFWYSDARRMYVESTRAHNTVQIDDLDHQRKGRPPYGSALERWGSGSGVIFSEAQVEHGSVRHVRVLLFRPREWLIVFDWLRDTQRASHRYRQWFHLAPDLEVEPRESGGFAVSSPEKDWESLCVIPLLAGSKRINRIRGQTEPELQGWWSPFSQQIVPNWAFGWEVGGVASHCFATLFAFGDDVARGPGLGRASRSGRSARFSFSVDGLSTRVMLKRPRTGEIRITRRVLNQTAPSSS